MKENTNIFLIPKTFLSSQEMDLVTEKHTYSMKWIYKYADAGGRWCPDAPKASK